MFLNLGNLLIKHSAGIRVKNAMKLRVSEQAIQCFRVEVMGKNSKKLMIKLY